MEERTVVCAGFDGQATRGRESRETGQRCDTSTSTGPAMKQRNCTSDYRCASRYFLGVDDGPRNRLMKFWTNDRGNARRPERRRWGRRCVGAAGGGCGVLRNLEPRRMNC